MNLILGHIIWLVSPLGAPLMTVGPFRYSNRTVLAFSEPATLLLSIDSPLRMAITPADFQIYCRVTSTTSYNLLLIFVPVYCQPVKREGWSVLKRWHCTRSLSK